MKAFLQRFGGFVSGVVHGFDRVRFRGSRRQLCHVAGMMSWLAAQRIRLTEYTAWLRGTSNQLCAAIQGPAEEQGIFCYLNNCQESKEETALRIAAEQNRREGLIAVLACVEPCRTIRVRGNRASRRLELRVELAKCKHYYHYYLDPVYGLRYTRLQTWAPFTMHMGFNGREWLARQMDQAGIAYEQKDNCFPWIADFAAAQRLADEQLTTAWPELLNQWMRQSNPLAETSLKLPVPYYWSVEAAEYATDVAFASAADLQHLYPQLVRHTVTTLQSTDLLRFMGYRVRQDGKPPLSFSDEATSKIKELVEGICVRHHVGNNVLKMYDKFGQVLRLETLLHDVRGFKVYRTLENDPDGPKGYYRMRQGVADLHQRAETSRRINDRYATSLATTEEPATLAELTKDLAHRKMHQGRSVRPLNPLAPEDAALLAAISRGEFLINGFRNRDVRAQLFDDATSAEERKKQSAKVTRLLGLLRGHGLIKKIAKTHRYQLTANGTRSTAILLAAREASTSQLLQAA